MKSAFVVEKARAEQIVRDYARKQTQNLALIAFYERHPDVRFCDANTKMITDYVGGAEYVGKTGTPDHREKSIKKHVIRLAAATTTVPLSVSRLMLAKLKNVGSPSRSTVAPSTSR